MREQLVAQITLGIASGDLQLGERLPSTREIARRCGLHANTVGSAYQKLADQKLLEFRKGSGFYVSESAEKRIEGSLRFDELIRTFVEAANALGFDESEIIKRMKKQRPSRHANQIIVVESDAGLRQILVHEIAARFPNVLGVSLEEFSSEPFRETGVLTAMFDEKPKIDGMLVEGQRCIYLKGRSVSAALSGESRPGDSETIAVVSGWDGFLTFARIMLLAAKVDPGRLIVRSSSDDGWTDAIKTASIVICDSFMVDQLDGRSGVRSFRIISDESLSELAATLRSE